jgi:hypothetical protein
MVVKANCLFAKGLVMFANLIDIFAYYYVFVANWVDVFAYYYVFVVNRVDIFADYYVIVANRLDIFADCYVIVANSLVHFQKISVHHIKTVVVTGFLFVNIILATCQQVLSIVRFAFFVALHKTTTIREKLRSNQNVHV